jgi:Protein of unknown function (DUF3311)
LWAAGIFGAAGARPLVSDAISVYIAPMPAENGAPSKTRKWSWWYLLFVVQFLVILWPPFYNKAEPTLLGIPFFYWFQLLWVIVSAVFTAAIYLATRESR